MGGGPSITASTKYSLLAGAEQHGSAHSALEKLLIRFPGEQQEPQSVRRGDRQKGNNRENTNLPAAVQSPGQRRERKLPNPKGKLRKKNEFLNPKFFCFFFFYSAITWDLPRSGLHLCFPAIILVFFHL